MFHSVMVFCAVRNRRVTVVIILWLD